MFEHSLTDCFQNFFRHELVTIKWKLEVPQQVLQLSLGYKIFPLIDHFNAAAFGKALSPDNEQSVKEHKTRFKGKHSFKQYL